MFLGEYQHTIDDKGRLTIPAAYRPALAAGLAVSRGVDRCIYIWTKADWDGFLTKLLALPMSADARKLRTAFASGGSEATLDKLGRILVPPFLRDYGDLRDEVVLVGDLNRIQVWNRQAWEAERSMTEEQMATFAEHLAGLGL